VVLLAIGVMATVVFVTWDRRFESYLSEAQRARNEAVVQTLVESHRAPDGWDASAIYALSRVAMLSNVDVAVYTTKGQLLFTLQGRHMGRGLLGTESPTDAGATASATPEPAPTAGEKAAASDQFDVSSYPLVVAGEKVATAEIYSPQDISTAIDDAYRRGLTRNLVIATLIALLLGFLVSLLVSRRVTEPLEELADAAHEVIEGNLDVRVAPRSEDEVGTLAAAFNELTDRLAQDEQLRRDMTTDFSNDLRPQLGAIRSHVEALEDGALPPTPENLHAIGTEVERLGRLISALRDLSALESEDLGIDLEEFDLAEAGREAVAGAAAAYATKGVELADDLSPTRLRADHRRVLQVMVGLLDNALKCTPSGGRVVLAVAGGDGPPHGAAGGVWAHLRVSDSGPGIEPADLPFVFDRFYRGRSARHAAGMGLALAVVRGLAETQGGVAVADSGPEGGAAFTVYLPLPR
jgi:two-component system sensor histidine kinase BaeS